MKPGLTSPELIANPYPFYEAMRKTDFFKEPSLNGYFITSYFWNDHIMKDKRLHSGGDRFTQMFSYYTPEQQASLKSLNDSLARWALFSDGEIHLQRRNSLARAFTPAVIEKLRGFVTELSTRLITDALVKKDRAEVMNEICYPLPVLVIGKLLGVPEEDAGKLKIWSEDTARLLGTPLRPYEMSLQAQKSLDEMDQYFSELIAKRRLNPKDDLISALAQKDLGLSTEDVVANCSMLLFAGHETTTNLLGNGIYLLMKYREHWEEFVAGKLPVGNLIEEMLRFESPVQYLARAVPEDITYGDNQIKKHERFFMVVAAANRDPKVFTNPNKFQPRRENAKAHSAFGGGSHFCIGAALSRLEGQVFFEKLAALCPTLKSTEIDSPKWRNILGFRGLETFNVNT